MLSGYYPKEVIQMVETFTKHRTGKPEKEYASMREPVSEQHNKNTFIADMTNRKWE